jgi:hypothetical protein
VWNQIMANWPQRAVWLLNRYIGRLGASGTDVMPRATTRNTGPRRMCSPVNSRASSVVKSDFKSGFSFALFLGAACIAAPDAHRACILAFNRSLAAWRRLG